MNNKNITFVFTLMTLTLLVACTSTTATETPAVPPTEANGGYPAPEIIDAEPPYPIETSGEDPFYDFLTPEAAPPQVTADSGALTLLAYYSDGVRPVRGQLFLTADMLSGQTGMGEDSFIPVVDPASSAGGYSDSHGRLVISDVLPGRYVLAVMLPRAPVLPVNVETDDIIIFEITADTITDLGDLVLDLDPTGLEPEE